MFRGHRQEGTPVGDRIMPLLRSLAELEGRSCYRHGAPNGAWRAPLLGALGILFELVGAAERSHKPKSAKSSFLLPNRFTFLPALLARSVRAVRALGIRTSKGKPRCNLICR